MNRRKRSKKKTTVSHRPFWERPLIHKFIEAFDWYGVFAILTAYALVSYEFLHPRSLSYQMLNATGSLGILIGCLTKKDYQPAVLNGVWLAIALIAILRLFL